MKASLYKVSLILLLISGLLSVSCTDDDDNNNNPGPSAPTTYNFDTYSQNSQQARNTTAKLAELTSEMKKGRIAANTVALQPLVALYTDHLSLQTPASFASQVPAWLADLSEASGKTWTPGEASNTTGGTYGGYLFNSEGVEFEQLVEKGSFGATLLYQAITNHFSGTVDAIDIDMAFAYYGADPAFPNNDKDGFGAKYAARRDNGGHYTRLKQNFLAARQAASAGNTEATKTAVAAIRKDWEEALAATVINYLYATSDKLSTGNPDDRAAAWHAWGEGIGFMFGLRAIPENQRILKNAQLNQVLVNMFADSETLKPIEINTPEEVAKFQEAIKVLAAAYGFADPSIYRINDVIANNR